MIILNIWENKKCSKPPTRKHMFCCNLPGKCLTNNVESIPTCITSSMLNRALVDVHGFQPDPPSPHHGISPEWTWKFHPHLPFQWHLKGRIPLRQTKSLRGSAEVGQADHPNTECQLQYFIHVLLSNSCRMYDSEI